MKLHSIVIAGALAALIAPAEARDTSFTFKGEYQGKSFTVDKLSDDECGKLLVKPLVTIPTDDGSKLAVPATDVAGRQCIATDRTEAPDDVMYFIGFPEHVTVYLGDGGGHVQMGNGPKLELNIAASFWSWHDDHASYLLVDNLIVTDDATSKLTCYPKKGGGIPCRKPEPQAIFNADDMIKLMNNHRKHQQQ